MTKQGILDAAKHLSIKENVSIQVLDRKTGKVVQEHTGHNQATNSLLFGIAHHLIGDFVPNERHGLNPGFSMLSNYVPRYISLGTMGLINQEQDSRGLPAGIGDNIIGASDDPTYRRLLEEVEEAEAELAAAEEALKNECPKYLATEACKTCQECSTRINDKKQAREDAKQVYADALDALMTYSEESRFVDYMEHTPGYSADGYNNNSSKNNNRKYFGLGYPYTSYDVNAHYKAETTNREADKVTYKGILYKCKSDTPVPVGQFDPEYWEALPDSEQPFGGKTINMELISNVYPRMDISYRDVVPEGEAELPNTIDIVFSAMISTGALAQFREEGKDYVFITEAGLWSKRAWTQGDENGLLAGYRILPPNKENWDMTVPANRKILKENILKVGINQVVQVIWKIQVGSIADFIESGDTPDVPPKYSDVAYIGLQPSYFSSDMAKLIYWHLFTDNLNDPYGQRCPSIPASFRRSKVKRGNPVPPNISNLDELLYLDFEMDDNEVTQTVWWWTQSGKMTLTSASSFYYWTYFYNSSTSAFYSIDVSHCYINTGVCNGQYGMTIRPDKGINYVSMNVANATFGPNGSIAFGGTYPLEITGLDSCVFEQSSGNIFGNPVRIHGDLVMDYVVRNKNIRVGNIYGFDTPNSAAYFRNWVIPSNYNGPFIWILSSQSEPYHIYVNNWVFANCTSLGELVSSNQPYQPVTWHGFETWDVSQMVNLSKLFLRITDIEGTLENWDVSHVTDMSRMFEDTEWNRTSITSIGSWDVSACMDFSYMFYTANSSHMGYGDYSFLDNWDVNPEANFQYILPYYQWVTKFPAWNGWFNTNAGATFIPYTGTEVERCYFRGIYNNISDLPATASEGDSYYILYAEYNKYFYHNGEWHTTA